MITREQIVAKARDFVGVPFMHQGRSRRGMDCGGLIFCVGTELGLVTSDVDDRRYAAMPGDFIDRKCKQHLVAKPKDQMQPGDVVTLRFLHKAIHCAIVTEVNGVLHMIHCFEGGTRRCVEHIMSKPWQYRIVGVYTYPGVTNG